MAMGKEMRIQKRMGMAKERGKRKENKMDEAGDNNNQGLSRGRDVWVTMVSGQGAQEKPLLQ